MIKKSIMVGFDGLMYLRERCGQERLENYRPPKQEFIDRQKREFDRHAINGKKQVLDGDLGGCDGDPHNAWEEGRWTRWSIADMTRMLDEQGYEWEYGEDTEALPVYI